MVGQLHPGTADLHHHDGDTVSDGVVQVARDLCALAFDRLRDAVLKLLRELPAVHAGCLSTS